MAEVELSPRQRIVLERCLRNVDETEREMAAVKLRLKEARSELERHARRIGTVITFGDNVIAVRAQRKGPMLPGLDEDDERDEDDDEQGR